MAAHMTRAGAAGVTGIGRQVVGVSAVSLYVFRRRMKALNEDAF